ncbi:butyrophilin subfamily 2 member A2-like [Leptodactylus fuscus]|uniref:butyrophilin subfamily 2 member A2-like n=1 Tax=Leptodactylus fuscus TaxID=238119 RepID=UPI003F4EBBB7
MNSKKSTKVNLVSSLVIWFIVVNVNLSSAEQFAVYSSSSSMTVDIGEGAFINCYLKPEVSAVDMEIQWIRVNDGSVIYKYRKGMEENHQAYNGRIKLVKTGIEKGNVTLEMHNIQPSDKGLYTCYFQNNFMFDEARIEILPRAIGTSPVLLMETDALNLKVSCSSSGWYPKPDGQWLSEDEKKVTELSKSIQKTEDGLYNINISIMFTEESKRTCVIQNSYPEHPINVSLYLSDSVFPKSNTGHIVAHALLTLIIIGMVSCIAVHKNKEKKRKAIKKEFKQAMKHSVDVCLDPETAHPDLRISDDLKCLSRTLERQKVPDNEKRFDTRLYVLGKEPLSNDQKY